MSEFYCENGCSPESCTDMNPSGEEQIGLQIRHLSNYIKKTIDMIAQDAEITGIQSFLLGHLVHEGKKRNLYQKDVEKFLHISKASVTSLLQQMEKKECIRRESVEGDARLKRIVVTPKGEEVYNDIVHKLTLMEHSMSKDISEQELKIFFSVIKMITHNLNETCESLSKKKES